MKFLLMMKQYLSLAAIFSSKLLLFLPCLILFLIKLMMGGGGTKQACAACKYQRRKCEKNCRLARYFPADQPKKFQNVHRLFGVSFIIKILKNVDDEKKDIAMATIIFESNIRARYPVHGCLGLVIMLENRFQNAVDELQYVNSLLAICKQQCQYQTPTGMDVNNLIPGNAGEFYGDLNEDLKPFVRIDHKQNQNHYCYDNSYNMLFNDGLGNIESQTLLSQGFPIQHDDVPFVAINIDRDEKPFTESKGRQVCNVPRVETKNKQKNGVRVDQASLSLISQK